jgi:hypothetical protein
VIQTLILQPIFKISGSGERTSDFEISSNGDFLSLLGTPYGIYGFHHLEYPEPAGMEFLQFSQNPKNGELSIVSVSHVDWSSMGGLWSPCAGSISP